MNPKPNLRAVFFRTDRGNEPVREWLEGLGERDERIIDADITIVAENWPLVLRTSLVKKLQGEKNLWEIRSRISGGKRIARVLFTIKSGEIILLHGFIKKSQKTPRKTYAWHDNETSYGNGGVNHMNKHRGSNFNDYLKERGISEEVSTLAQKRWDTLRAETTSLETENTTEAPDNPPKCTNRILHWLRHRINHLFS